MTLQFVGILPTTGSMFVPASLEDRIFLTAWSGAEVLDNFETKGWRGLEELSTPVISRQPVTLTGPGITHVELGTFFARRGDINIDDLSFSATPIPEPPTVLLAVLGLVVVGRLCHSRNRAEQSERERRPLDVAAARSQLHDTSPHSDSASARRTTSASAVEASTKCSFANAASGVMSPAGKTPMRSSAVPVA